MEGMSMKKTLVSLLTVAAVATLVSACATEEEYQAWQAGQEANAVVTNQAAPDAAVVQDAAPAKADVVQPMLQGKKTLQAQGGGTGIVPIADPLDSGTTLGAQGGGTG
jgi:hypothetical protein